MSKLYGLNHEKIELFYKSKKPNGELFHFHSSSWKILMNIGLHIRCEHSKLYMTGRTFTVKIGRLLSKENDHS